MEEIHGFFIRTVFRNLASGYSIFIINTQKNSYTNVLGDLKCEIGIMLDYMPRTPLRIIGEYSEDRKLFVVSEIKEDSTNKEMLEKYLSETFDGIGPVKAKKIVSEFEDFFSEIRQPGAAEKLLNAGMLKEQISKFIKFYSTNHIKWEILNQIIPYGGTFHHMELLFATYGANATKQLSTHPYEVANNIGLPFTCADRIAKENGRKFADHDRLMGILGEIANKLFKSGSTYWTLSEFISEMTEFYTESFSETISPLIASITVSKNNPFVFCDSGKVIHKYINQLETICARQINRIMGKYKSVPVDYELVNQIEKKNGFKFGNQQRMSFSLITAPGISILTGEPGAGKTTTVNSIITYFEICNPGCEIKLCAPTGRAAQRMYETTGREATTIHQLLELTPYEESQSISSLSADMIVVDEFSMVDIELFSKLLSACKTGCTLLLVGDVNQLESVGPGCVLNDLIKSKYFKTVHLSEVFRQVGESGILYNAKKMIAGENKLEIKDDFQIIKANTEEEITEIIKEINTFESTDDIFSLQVLSPTYKGDAGVDFLNTELQNLNHLSGKKLSYRKNNYYKGDKITFSKNNYQTGYFNGDLGIGTEIYDSAIDVQIGDNTLNISGNDLEDIQLAYCTTIHKSQGTEYPCVIIALPSRASLLLRRNLLYTAITRAKKKVYIVYDDNALDMALNNMGVNRNTLLQEKLKKFIIR